LVEVADAFEDRYDRSKLDEIVQQAIHGLLSSTLLGAPSS
jgi:hypothetical protein